MTLPTVGRIVHYQSYGTPGGEHAPAPQAAIVTKAEGNLVSLAVLYDNGLSFKTDVPHAEGDEPAAGCWNWPPRD
ncbi:hypothetical protein [Nocardia acidivorans]|uniref:hypothetical protein n=1 Tax=Nocardia acidivorans TaxID=404580 RepID=UPI000837A589|nr:hypothetical protein [Nocardia acidivorans]